MMVKTNELRVGGTKAGTPKSWYRSRVPREGKEDPSLDTCRGVSLRGSGIRGRVEGDRNGVDDHPTGYRNSLTVTEPCSFLNPRTPPVHRTRDKRSGGRP